MFHSFTIYFLFLIIHLRIAITHQGIHNNQNLFICHQSLPYLKKHTYTNAQDAQVNNLDITDAIKIPPSVVLTLMGHLHYRMWS